MLDCRKTEIMNRLLPRAAAFRGLSRPDPGAPVEDSYGNRHERVEADQSGRPGRT